MKICCSHLIYCLFLLCAGLAAAEFAVDYSGETQLSPDIDGSMVVWAEYIYDPPLFDDYDILGIDLESTSGYIYIVNRSNDQNDPRLAGSLLTWEDDFYGDGTDYDIYLSDISNPFGILQYPVAITPDISESNPAIHGTTVVWQVNNGTAVTTDWNIRGADMADPNFPFIYAVDTRADTDQRNPAIYRNRVVYQDDANVHQDILSADVWMKTAPTYNAVFTDDDSGGLDQTLPAVWGNIVVFRQQSQGLGDIVAVDMTDPANPVPMVICDDPANQATPDISNHIVVWQDDRNGHWDIYGYNLITKQEFRITDNTADQTDPAISGDTVVWVDMRDDVATIWAEYLDPVDIADCPVSLPGDTNGDCKINLTDFTNFAANWLACNLEPVSACSN